MTRRFYKDEIESYARMVWSYVYNQCYSWDYARATLAKYGLDDDQISRVVIYAEQHAQEWSTQLRRLEMEG